MNETLRKSGIPLVEESPWGTHICVFYETKQDLLETAAAYFAAGLEANEWCVWAISEPIAEEEARAALRESIPDLDRHLAAGTMEFISSRDWYLNGDEFDMQRITDGWREKLRHALRSGYAGLRMSGNAFWIATNHWQEFCDYEHELGRSLVHQPMLCLCTYSLQATRAVDVLDVARAHNFTLARRNGEWQFMETAELKQANDHIRNLNDALAIMTTPSSGPQQLTERERVVLAQTVKGASSKEAARALGISPRTVEFHRANIMHKLGARNIAEVVRVVLNRR